MRILRGGLALVVLLVGVVGVPWVLVLLGGNPLPAQWDLEAVRRALLRPDDGTILIGLIALVAWAAWLVFTVSVVVELSVAVVGGLSGRRIEIGVPGLAGPRRLVAGLVLSVLALASAPNHAQADLAPPTSISQSAEQDGHRVEPAEQESRVPSPASPRASVPETKAPSQHDHIVEAGDDLWTLSERYYGQGREWRAIARANPDVLTGGPDRLQPGWRLVIPGADPSTARVHEVRSGDTLSSIAAAAYGDGDRWEELYLANRAQLADPDDLAVGIRLTLPSQSEIGRAATRTARERSDAPEERGRSRGDERSDQDKGTRQSESTDPSEQQDRANDPPRGDDQESTSGGSRKPSADQPPGDSREGGPREGDPSTTPSRSPASRNSPASSSSPEASSSPAGSAAPVPVPSERVVPTGAPGTEGSATAEPTTAGPTTAEPTTAEPTTAGPTTAGPTAAPTSHANPASTTSGAVPAPAPAPPAPPRLDTPTGESLGPPSIVVGLASIGGLLAAGIMAGVALRRRTQRQLRPIGRRILSTPDPAEMLEATLGRRQRPMGRRTLDLAVRAIGAHCHVTGAPLPELELVWITDDTLVLEIVGGATPPDGFRVEGSTWVLDQVHAEKLRKVPGVGDAARPYPALVCVGRDEAGAQLLVDLERVGLLGVSGTADVRRAVLTALTAELAFSAWSDEMVLTVVGADATLAEALDQHNVSATGDLDVVLGRLEARAAVQRDHDPTPVLGQRRIDPDMADPWVPEIVLVDGTVTPEQQRRLEGLLLESPRVTMAAVLGGADPRTPWVLDHTDGAEVVTLRRPTGPSIGLVPQHIDPPAAAALADLVRAASSEETERAPWWDADESPPSPSNVRYVERWGLEKERSGSREGVELMAGGSELEVRHPTLLLLGKVDLIGATGTLPPRASRQCLEYCAWLLHRRETTARAMAAGLAVAEGTRRSNMSRLRTWLGNDDEGRPYLPDAYSGHITLNPLVSSDWQHLQMLTAPAVNRASTPALRAALQLVRGAPLADSAPGQWHWAEGMRTDMISVIRDIGVELASRALTERDIDLARWAASRALSVAPGDELLIRMRIRTEHQAGNVAEVERLILQLASQARSLGLDLDPETVVLLQEMMEGQVRARLA